MYQVWGWSEQQEMLSQKYTFSGSIQDLSKLEILGEGTQESLLANLPGDFQRHKLGAPLWPFCSVWPASRSIWIKLGHKTIVLMSMLSVSIVMGTAKLSHGSWGQMAWKSQPPIWPFRGSKLTPALEHALGMQSRWGLWSYWGICPNSPPAYAASLLLHPGSLPSPFLNSCWFSPLSPPTTVPIWRLEVHNKCPLITKDGCMIEMLRGNLDLYWCGNFW